MTTVYDHNGYRTASRSRTWLAHQARHIDSIRAGEIIPDAQRHICVAHFTSPGWISVVRFHAYAECAGFLSRSIFNHCWFIVARPLVEHDECLYNEINRLCRIDEPVIYTAMGPPVPLEK